MVRITGLAPHIERGFSLATFGIGDVLRAVRSATAQLPAGQPRTVDVHLTGGYKAALQHTLALAEILRSTAYPDSVEVTACYLFEQTATPVAGAQPPPLTEIGLRT